MEPLVHVLVLEEETLAHVGDVVCTVEAEVLVLEESMAPEAESLAPEENVA